MAYVMSMHVLPTDRESACVRASETTRRSVHLPTVPSPTITHLIVCIVLLTLSEMQKKQDATIRFLLTLLVQTREYA